MADVILSTNLVDADDGSETERVNIQIFTSNDDWLGLYNRLKVYRSKTGASGPFEEITDEAWVAPRIPDDAGDEPSSPVTGSLVNIVGKELEMTLDGDELLFVFTGSDPLTLSQVATQIEAQSNNHVNSYVDSHGQLVVEAVQPGLASQIEVLESEGATILELPVTKEQGNDTRLALDIDQTHYSLVDPFGNKDYYYRTRFFNSATGAQSEASVASTPRPNLGVSLGNVVIGYAQISLANGLAAEHTEVILSPESDGTLTDGRLIVGSASKQHTDEHGYAEFKVVRGQRYTVSVSGTQLVRTITVPVDPTITSFSLFDSSIADDDVFTVSVPEIVIAERRTL